MRRFYLIILIIMSVGFFVSCDNEPIEPENTQTIEALAGGDFNTWIEFTQGEVSFDEPAGEWWDGLNYLSVIGGPITVTKTTDAYSGEYAVRLETKLWGNELSIPGILASGYFDSSLPIGENLVIGKPLNKKPISLNGFIKYLPADNDTLVIFVALTKFDSTRQVRDTIGQGEYVYSGTLNSYTAFTLPINYEINTTPDSVHVILLSSVSGKEMKGHPGSVLFVDELSFTYE